MTEPGGSGAFHNALRVAEPTESMNYALCSVRCDRGLADQCGKKGPPAEPVERGFSGTVADRLYIPVRLRFSQLFEAIGACARRLGAVAREGAPGGTGPVFSEIDWMTLPTVCASGHHLRGPGRGTPSCRQFALKAVTLDHAMVFGLRTGRPPPAHGVAPAHGAVLDRPDARLRAPLSALPGLHNKAYCNGN